MELATISQLRERKFIADVLNIGTGGPVLCLIATATILRKVY
tara:strand:- start:417 stop:542 length:126 start_codon:yes stop_codon:yes gene_type:complete